MKTINTNKASELKVGDILVFLATGEMTEVTDIQNRSGMVRIYTSCAMKPDYRKKRTVYRGLEIAMLTPEEYGSDEEHGQAFQSFRERSMTPEQFEKYYRIGYGLQEERQIRRLERFSPAGSK